MATKKPATEKATDKDAVGGVTVQKLKAPLSPSEGALSFHADKVALGAGSAVTDDDAPTLAVFDLAKKRAALALTDPGTVVLERGGSARYISNLHWLADGRVAYVRPRDDGNELVLRAPIEGGAAVTMSIGGSGSLEAVTPRHIAVMVPSPRPDDALSMDARVFSVPAPGAPLGDAVATLQNAYRPRFAGGALWKRDTGPAWVGSDASDGKQRKLEWAVDGMKLVRGHGNWLVCADDYQLNAMDVTTQAAVSLKDKSWDYKTDVATHDGRVLVSTTTGELVLLDLAKQSVVWREQVATRKRSLDSVSFSGDGSAALGAAHFEPFGIVLLRFA